ncbi:MAG: dienelactone hydrolase family protein [Acidimicrobiia bacterium]
MDTAMMAETVTITGHGGEDIEAYLARPLGPGPFPGIVVIHHMPGYDRATKEMVRTFAVRGYTALCPNLFHRYAPGAPSGEAAKAALEAGGVPDDQCLGDVAGALHHLRAMPNASGRVAVIGHCSGGRQAYVVAARLDVDAAIDCYGGRVVATAEDLTPARPVAPIDMTADLRCPLLGLFGAEDSNPSPEHVARMEHDLRAHDKDFEFHSFADAGHAFFSVDRPLYRVEAAKQGWRIIWEFLDRRLGVGPV